MKTQTPILIEVITRIPTTFVQCWGCEAAFGLGGMSDALHNEQLNAFPEEAKQEAATLVEWTKRLRRRFGRRVRVHFVDALSFRGFWLSLRHRVRHYPAFIIAGRLAQIGLDPSAGSGQALAQLDAVIAASLAPT